MEKQAIVIAGLGFGDEGKGTMIDYLTRKHVAHTVVRYNGGAQAAHNVVTADGRHHTFSQFGSGGLVPGVQTYLSHFMILEPAAMMNEERHLQELGITDAFGRTTIHEDALVITPFQMAANRLREALRGQGRHGSCGLGVGETMQDSYGFPSAVLRAKDLRNAAQALVKLRVLREVKREELAIRFKELPDTPLLLTAKRLLTDPAVLDRCVNVYTQLGQMVRVVDDAYFQTLANQSGTLLFEGAQGVLLDVRYGFHPYKTKTNITFHNATQLLNQAGYEGSIKRMGIVRSYATRHGAGPFVTEDAQLNSLLVEPHNAFGQWQGSFRVGYFDALAIRYALRVLGGVDEIALTHLDRIRSLPITQVCTGYQSAGINAKYFYGSQGVIKNIKVSENPNDQLQAGLTQELSHVQPQYTPTSSQGGCAAYLQFLEQELQTPITITSSGPTAEDK